MLFQDIGDQSSNIRYRNCCWGFDLIGDSVFFHLPLSEI